MNAALAGLALIQIRKERKQLSHAVDQPALGTAYIIRQFKRPEEINLMRSVYGRKFIQVSVFGSETDRRIDKQNSEIRSSTEVYSRLPNAGDHTRARPWAL